MSKAKGQRKTTRAGAGRGAGPNRTGRASAKHVFQVLVEQDEAGYFVAECPALRACYIQGKTYEAVIENIKDVIALCLAEMKERGERIPPLQPEIIGITGHRPGTSAQDPAGHRA